MANNNLMDDKLYEAARCTGTQIPPPPADVTDYYLRVTPGDENNALHVAALHGNHKFVKEILSLVDHSQMLCKRNSKWKTPLHLAAESGNKETVEEIINAHDLIIDEGDCRKLDCWRERDKQGDTPLHIALRLGHDQLALSMLERDLPYLVTLYNNVGEGLAYLAAQNYCPDFLTRILDADRDGLCCVSFSGPFGQTAFHPIFKNLAGEIISISIQRRKHLLKSQDNKGKTVLHYAVEEENGPAVEIILKEDNTIAYLHDNDGMTPLHIAATRGFLHIVQTILKLCPQSIAICDKKRGQTALHVVKMDDYSLDKCLKNTRMRELINQVDNDGNTPLHLALINSDLATAEKLLLVDGINWRLANKVGRSPMDLCVSHDKTPLKLRQLAAECMAKKEFKMDLFFNEKVAKVDDVLDHYSWDECLNYKGPQGDNILHTAAKYGSLKIINRVRESDSALALLLVGQNSEGETPLHLAAQYGQLKVEEFILSLVKSENNPSVSVAIENGTKLMSINSFGDYTKPWRIKSSNGDTAAHKAIRNRHAKSALLLLQRDPELVTVTNDAKESLLYLAADNNCYGVIVPILSKYYHSGDSFTSGRCGQNFFHAAARCPLFYSSHYTSLIQKQPHLIKKLDDNGKTPLHHAAKEGRGMRVRWLLKWDKSAAFVFDNEGYTPLLTAAVLGRSKCLRLILSLCPQSVELRDVRCNRTVLHLAKMPQLFLQICMGHEMMKKIINETDNNGNTALHTAIIDGDVDKALILLQSRDINYTIRNNQQHSAEDLCGQLIISGETNLVPIAIALVSLTAGDVYSRRTPVYGSWIKAVLMAYYNMIMNDDNLKKLLDNIAVAAALLVTITFAAAFTIPGGYESTGDAVLIKKNAAVKVFIASDILAMLMAISILIWYTLGGRRTHLRKLAMDCIIMLQISILATIVSFLSGVFAIGWHVKSVVIVPIIIAAVFNLFFIFRVEFFEFYFG